MSEPANPSRRRVLLSAGAAALALPAAPLAAGTGPRPGDPLPERVAALFADRDSAAAVGRRYLAGQPGPATARELLDALGLRDGDAPGDAALREHLGARSREDFRHGRVVRLDGWLLSHTDAQRCALAALAAG